MFAIVGMQRTGTTALGGALAQRDDTAVWGEVFIGNHKPRDRHDSFFAYWAERVCKDSKCIYPRSPEYYPVIDDFFDRLKAEKPCKHLGFKIKYDQMTIVPNLLHWLKRRRVKIIHLKRRSLLETLISHKSIAVRTELGLSAHTASNADDEPEFKIDLPDEAVLRQELDKLRARIREGDDLVADLPHLQIFYEDLYGEAKGVLLRRIQKFAGMAPEAIDFPLRKSIDRDIADLANGPAQRDMLARLKNEDCSYL